MGELYSLKFSETSPSYAPGHSSSSTRPILTWLNSIWFQRRPFLYSSVLPPCGCLRYAKLLCHKHVTNVAAQFGVFLSQRMREEKRCRDKTLPEFRAAHLSVQFFVNSPAIKHTNVCISFHFISFFSFCISDVILLVHT